MKIIFFACLLTLIIISAIAVVVNILDVSTPFLNPPFPTVSQFISIDYPSATGLVFNATPVVHININLTTSGTFVQDQIVNLDAAGTISQSLIGKRRRSIQTERTEDLNSQKRKLDFLGCSLGRLSFSERELRVIHAIINFESFNKEVIFDCSLCHEWLI